MKKNQLFGLTCIALFALVAFGVMTAPVVAQDDKVVVGIDLAHNAYHARADDLHSIFGTLEDWGYEYKNLTSAFTAADLADVDILLTMNPDSKNATFDFTQAEIDAVAAWMDEGAKGLWACGDSDYADEDGDVAKKINVLLEAAGSNILVEQASIESTLNADAAYRVRPGNYTDDEYVNEHFYAGTFSINKTTFFHGPAPVLGVDSEGNMVALESNQEFFDEYNVFPIVQAVNGNWTADNEIYESSLTRGSLEGLKYQVHELSSTGAFMMMAAQRYVGEAGTSKVVVSGEVIFSDYKEMFSDADEYDNPSNNKILVKNTLAWLSAEEAKSAPGFEVLLVLAGLVALVPIVRRRR